jgi:hypothetical protein
VPGGEKTVETTADRLRQEGILIGEAKAFKVMLQELLLDRFDMLHPALEEKINSINSQETLKYLFRKAMKVESIQEFSRIIDRLS